MVDHFGKAYVAGNVAEGYPEVSKDNWAGGVQPDAKADVATVLPQIRVDTPFPHAALSIESAETAYQHVLENVGARLPKRDAVDQRIIEMVRTGKVTEAQMLASSKERAAFFGYAQRWIDELADSVPLGFITDPREVGGYPNYQGQPYADADLDGLPDSWEQQHGLSPSDPADAVLDSDGDGYSHIEEFINGVR